MCCLLLKGIFTLGGTSIYVSPQQMKKRFGTSASFMCNVVGEQPSRITWIRRTGTGGVSDTTNC